MNYIAIFSFFASIIIVGLFVWVLILKFKEEDEPTDDLIFRNFMPQYTEGYSMGSVIEVIRGEERTGIRFLPKDVDYVSAFKKRKSIVLKPQLVWIENRKLLSMHRGILSMHRNELWGLPPNPEDLPEAFKNTEFGKALMHFIESGNSDQEESNILRERIAVQNKLLKKTEGLGLVEDYFSKTSEIIKDLGKLKGDKKTSVFQDSLNPRRD